MISAVSTTLNVTHKTKEIIDHSQSHKTINIEKIHIEKNILTTNIIHEHRLNYTYNFQHRVIYQPVTQLGNTLNIMA